MDRSDGHGRETTSRTKRVQALASDLAKARDVAEVLDAIVQHAVVALNAQRALVGMLDADGVTMTLVRAHGDTPDLFDRHAKLPIDFPAPITEVTRTHAPLWIDGPDSFRARYPDAPGELRAAVCALPLVVDEGATIGALSVAWSDRHDFSVEEQSFLVAVARLCAQALDRARLFEELSRTNAELSQAERRYRRIFESNMVGMATWQGDRVVEANDAMLTILGRTRAELAHRPLDLLAATPEEWRAADARALEQLLSTGTCTTYEKEFLRPDGTRVPVLVGGATWQGTRDAGIFYALDIGARTRVHRGQTFLLRAGELLASSLDYRATLAAIARLAVPQLADWCSIELLDEHGMPHPIEVAHVDPQKVAFAAELRKRYPPDPKHDADYFHRLRTGEPNFVPDIPQELLLAAARDEEHKKLILSLNIRSGMMLPLRARDRTLGALTLIHAESGRRYDEQDLAVGVELARRAATAIDNATLFYAERAARDAADRAFDRLARLQRVTAALVAAATPQAVIDAVLHDAVSSMGAVAAVLVRCVDARTLEVVGSIGFEEETIEKNRTFDVDRPLPLPRAVRDRSPIYLASPEEASQWPGIPRSERKAWAALPLVLGDRAIGGLWIAYGKPQTFTREEQDFLMSIAQQSAQAMDRARLLDAERAARRNVEDALRVREEFLSIASHELKTPITGLSLQLQALLRTAARGEAPSAERVATRLKGASEQVRRLTSLVDDLLDVSRLTAGRLRLDIAPVELSVVVAEVAERFDDDMRVAGCTPTIALAEGVTIMADRMRVDQVATNLLTNAMKYGRGKPIEISTRIEGEHGVLVVRDHGIGIAPEAQARIFERFERAVDSASISGFGLGLWIVKNLLDSMGGSIAVVSAPNQGAEFTVRWPRART